MADTEIRKLVKKTRSELGMSQTAFSAYLGMQVATLQRWETGSASPGGLATARLIEAGVKVDELIQAFEDDETAKKTSLVQRQSES